MTKHGRMRGGVVFPAKEIIPILEKAVEQRKGEASGGPDRGISALARELADRFGTRVESEMDQLRCFLNGRRETISERLADRWLTFLGYNYRSIWTESDYPECYR